MALESLEERQARAERDRAHEARQVEAIEQERTVLDRLHRRTESAARVGRKAAPAPGENKAMTPATENKAAEAEEADALDGVQFASGAAEDAAREAGLTSDDFKRRRKSSERGFTLADVRKLTGDE
jgi:hypothetical protein